ncbi:MAG: glycosyltransferase family 4 protein [Patescibacteria group bacterium]
MNKDKKIFIAADVFPPQMGGPATYSLNLAKHLHEKGYKVKALVYGHLHQRKPKVKFSITKVSLRWPLPLRYFFYFIQLFFLSYNYDVIYAQGPVASGWPAFLVSRLTAKRLIVKIVGDYAWEQARLTHKTEQGIDDWQKNPKYKEVMVGKSRLLINMQKAVVKTADKVIVPSHYLKKIVVGWGAKEDSIEVIYNNVSLPDPVEASKGEVKQQISVSGNILISVGRLVPWKGFDFLIKLMPDLLKMNPEFKLIIIGDGPELKEYQKIIQELNLVEKVFLPGGMSQEKLLLYFKASDMFLLNTEYEGLSHVILEAMFCNVPIIVSDMGGNPEIIDHEINGLLIEYNNKEEWLKAIKRIWEDEDNKLRTRLTSHPTPKLPCFNFDELVTRTLVVLLGED